MDIGILKGETIEEARNELVSRYIEFTSNNELVDEIDETTSLERLQSINWLLHGVQAITRELMLSETADLGEIGRNLACYATEMRPQE